MTTPQFDPRTAAAHRIVWHWPSDGWITEGELAEQLADTHPIHLTSRGFVYGDLGSLKGILSHARRKGFLIRDQRTQPPTYTPVDSHPRKRLAVTQHG